MSYAAVDVFDVAQTVFGTILLVITIPLASYVYFKLLFAIPFSDNYTFKLIVVNGITGLLNSLTYLIFIQLTSYFFMYDFYKLIERRKLVTFMSLMNAFFAGMSLNSALFVALNRVKRILFTRLNENDSVFFLISIIISLLLSLPGVLDFCFFTSVSYLERKDVFSDVFILIPATDSINEIMLNISNVIAAAISIATFVVNIILAIMIIREGQFASNIRTFNAERGLIITSVVSYVFYMLYFINNLKKMYNADQIFDICQSIVVSILLVITVPLASYVYFKLMFARSFSDNYTFKLIAVNGIVGILSVLIYLLFLQLTSYHFMYGFYKFIERNDLILPLVLSSTFFNGMSINTHLFVALNRINRVVFQKMKGNDSVFFFASMLLATVISLPGVLDYAIFTTLSYKEWIFDGVPILYPSTKSTDTIFLTISNVLAAVVSVITLVVNMLLALMLAREGQYKSEIRKFNAERGLIFTSIVSYVFYTLYLINRVLAQMFTIPFCANSQFLFLGVARLSPVWCLLIFAPSIRRSVFTYYKRKTLTPVQSTIIKQTLNIWKISVPNKISA